MNRVRGKVRWSEDDAILSVILEYCNGLILFRFQSVCRKWRALLENASSSCWQRIVMAVVPSCATTIALLDHVTPMYREHRHFSKMSLGNMLTLQHVFFVDTAHFPLGWITSVPVSTFAAKLYDVAEALTFGEIDPIELSLLASGVCLERAKTISEHAWPVRRGARGWRLDLIVVIRGFNRSRQTAASIVTEAPIVDGIMQRLEKPVKVTNLSELRPIEFSEFCRSYIL